jgi:hypothetical protein
MKVILKGHGSFHLTRLMGRALEKIICVENGDIPIQVQTLIQRLPQTEQALDDPPNCLQTRGR